MVGHQAITLCAEAEALAMLAEEFEVRTAVVINEENNLTVVAALNNVMRLTRSDDSGHARHADNLPLASRKVNKYDCPSLSCSCSLLLLWVRWLIYVTRLPRLRRGHLLFIFVFLARRVLGRNL